MRYIDDVAETISLALRESKDEQIIITIYEGFYNTILKMAEKGNEGGLTIPCSFFQRSYREHYRSRNQQLRLIIIMILEKLFITGKLGIHSNNKVLYCYLCDENQSIRSHANRIVRGIWDKNLYGNFGEIIASIIQYIEETYN